MSAIKHINSDSDKEEMNEHITASELARSLHNLSLSKEAKAKKDKAYYDELEISVAKIIKDNDSKFLDVFE